MVKLGTGFLPLVNSVAQAIMPIVNALMPQFEAGLAEVQPVIDAVSESIRLFVESMTVTGDPVQALTLALLDFPDIAPTVLGIVKSVQDFMDQAQQVIGPVADWIGQNVDLQDVLVVLAAAIGTIVVPAIISMVAAAAPVVAAAVVLIAIVAALRQAWESDFGGIRTFVQNTLQQIQTWWAQHGTQVQATVQGFLDTVKGIFDSAFSVYRNIFAAFQSAFEGDWTGFGENLRKAWDVSLENLKTLVNNALTWFQNVDWGAVAKGITDGIATGITNGAKAIADAAKAAAKAALDAAKGFLGIESPSRAFMAVGRMATAGFAEGINEVDPVEAATRDMGRAAIEQTTKTVQNNRTTNISLNVSNKGNDYSGVTDAAVAKALWG
jgi:phage-related protein